MGCCTSLLYGTIHASKNTVNLVLTSDYQLGNWICHRTGYTRIDMPVRIMISIIPRDTLILEYKILT